MQREHRLECEYVGRALKVVNEGRGEIYGRF